MPHTTNRPPGDTAQPLWAGLLLGALRQSMLDTVPAYPHDSGGFRCIGPQEDPYLYRWFLRPRNTLDGSGNAYLHQFHRSDDDRAHHDHPWPSTSVILSGGYWEHMPGLPEPVWRSPGTVHMREALSRHRVELATMPDGSPLRAWTLFLTGPVERDWGFWCPDAKSADERFVPWQEFTSGPDGNTVGKGCGE